MQRHGILWTHSLGHHFLGYGPSCHGHWRAAGERVWLKEWHCVGRVASFGSGTCCRCWRVFGAWISSGREKRERETFIAELFKTFVTVHTAQTCRRPKHSRKCLINYMYIRICTVTCSLAGSICSWLCDRITCQSHDTTCRSHDSHMTLPADHMTVTLHCLQITWHYLEITWHYLQITWHYLEITWHYLQITWHYL